jgi:ankyrin repeat protein
MVDAIAVDLEASPTFDPRNRSPHPSDIFRLCESLVMLIPVIGVTDGEDQEQNLQVQLAHPSVRQFLLSDRAHAIFGLQMEKSFANAEIAKICLAYLSHVTAHGLSLKDMRSQFPFAQYSATYWSDHARLAEATDDVLLDAVASFFASGNAVFDTCYRLSDPDRPQLSTDDDRVPELLDPLYIASLQGLEQAVERLLERGSDINARCGLYGHPLQAASFAGYHSTVEILLNGGADVNAQGGRYGNALQAASANGHVSITRMLLGMGADVNAQDGDSETLLYGASKKGLEQLVQMFLESGAETDARGGEYGTALQVAALKGYREIVKILVNHGADVHAHLNNHGTALQIAAEVGHGDIVAILLDGEADIMTAGRPGSTLLHAVARNGHTHILKLLISRVSFIGLTDSAGCSLIDIAAQKGHLGVVKLLLDKGVDVSTTDSEGWTPLNRAADEGHLELVKLLIEKGADSEIMNNLGRTPIHSAAKKGHLEVVVFMLDRGVRFNRHGAETSKAVGGASHVGHGETLQVQLARTSSQQEGHSNVASSEFHDSGYSSRQPQPIVDEYGGGESQPFDDDIESVGSVETDIQSSTESLALSNVREAAAREIARAFSGDSEISKLYDEGLKRMDDSGFIKNHRRLLKLFYLEAAKDAEVASHHVILRFLRSRIARIRVSARIIEAKDSPDEELELAMDRSQSLRLINGVLTQADKERDTSRWTEAHRSDLNEQSGVFSGSGEDIWASLTHESPELLADNLDDLEDFDDEDFDDLDANNEEGAVLHVDDLSHVPAIVSMTAFLMDGRAFRIYRNNLQRFAYGKRIAPIALKHALVANDLALAIELLENEPEAVTQSRLGFEWIKEPLALDFTPAEVVRLIIERRKGSSWLDKSGKAIGVGRWGQARELIRGDQPRTLNKLRIITHLAAMDRPAINSAELDDGLPPPSYSRRDLFGVLPWKELIEHLEKRTHAMCLDIWKQGISRVRESMVWFGLILGPLEPGYTRITWKSVSFVLWILL